MSDPTPQIERPTVEQREAATPHVSAWVGANAGSGKTRVLTQRVARLLLDGADPAKILCLTYTKAAAAEMQTRLFEMLGGWAMQPAASLAEMLGALEGTAPVTDPARLAMARRLFAQALETPGGLKIQTIHAFCDALLRRFPLEAGVSPNFDVLDDRQSALTIAAIRARMAEATEAGESPAFDLIAKRLNEDAVEEITTTILHHRAQFGATDVDTALTAYFGPVARLSERMLADEQIALLLKTDIAGAIACFQTHGAKTEKAVAEALMPLHQGNADNPAKLVREVRARVLTGGNAVRKSGFPTKGVENMGGAPFTDALNQWALDTVEALNAHTIAARTSDLHGFGENLLTRYASAKSMRGLLDFNDLIERTRELLTSAAGPWVLYKLDQGIDHLLVDEAQDTSPAQWAVIEAITEDFHSGEGARQKTGGADRSVFVVGDEKQSIYSFQGAEPQAFGATRARYVARLDGIGKELKRPDLVTSFRSAPGILEFVDEVFAGEAGAGLTVDKSSVSHRAHRARDSARVDLWPLIEPEKRGDDPSWDTPVDTPPPDHPKTRLAAILAGEIARMIAEDTLPARDGQPARRVRAGDILILVRKRDALARGLIRNMKAAGVPVAGADRLDLAGELVVKDVLAVLKALALPSDDLSLACVLRSPFCDIGEEALFALSHGREATLWQALMQAGAMHPREAAMMRDLANKAGFQRPYDLLETLLIGHDGRRRLLARLGPEAEDPLDELLAEALKYEALETPSLAGFIAWIEAADITLKREMDKGAGQVRVMTIHGAKGLEAPVVILPDTVFAPGRSGNRQTLLSIEGDGNRPPLTLWASSKTEDDSVTAAARATAEAKMAAETARILYVGLTRAEDWLILCGAGDRTRAEQGWYAQLSDALRRCGPHEIAPPPGLDAPVLRVGEVAVSPPAPDRDTVSAKTPASAPEWLAKAGAEPRARRLSPSRLLPSAGEGGEGLGREQALEFGSALHLALERLAEYPADHRQGAGARLLAAAFPRLGPDLHLRALADAAAIFADPALADLFGPGSQAEVPLTLDLAEISGGPMLGRIDRLVVSTTGVLAVDFKTDPQVPGTPHAIDPAYLAQQAAYGAALGQIWTGRAITTAILWTATRELMEIPADLLADSMATLRVRHAAGD